MQQALGLRLSLMPRRPRRPVIPLPDGVQNTQQNHQNQHTAKYHKRSNTLIH
ncbi:hypothetical protein QFZ40_001868 [Arthrobacter pascens]|nr:hypothetical protein [Arthrobacter pascens]